MLAALALMLFTLVSAAVVSRNVLERLPHLEDEFAYLYQAKIFARGQVWVPRDEQVKVFWQPFVLQPEDPDDGVLRRFGKYIPGWPLVLTPGVWLGQPWVINAFLAMLSVGLVYRLGKEVFGEPAGLVAALLTAISPMALLLNATLMSHTWAMFAALVFVYAYWRTLKRGRGVYLWAMLGGLMIGGIVITRPLTAIALAAPFALHGLWRLWSALWDRKGLAPTFRVLFVMAVAVLPVTALWPLFNHVTTGDWRTNTYTLLWRYDKVGFGEGYGLNRGGHTLTWGWRNARADLREWLRDLYGFTMQPGFEEYARANWVYGAGAGLSWIPVIAGLIVGRRKTWTWLLFGQFVCLVGAGLFYWIGAVVHGSAAYSVRYYYEATFAVSLVAGNGVVVWAQSLRRPRPALNLGRFSGRLRLAWNQLWPGYVILFIAVGLSIAGYTPARFREPLPPDWDQGLYQYNKASRVQLDAIQALRGNDPRPVLLVILRNPDREIRDNWRDYAAMMAATSPYLDSDIVVARIFEPDEVQEFLRRFPERLVLYQIGEHFYTSVEEALAIESARQSGG
jgi:hypothetical protein